MAALVLSGKLIYIREKVDACRDPRDNHILELAVNGKATCTVSGDADLLELNPFREIAILNPDDFLSLYNGGRGGIECYNLPHLMSQKEEIWKAFIR
jgi:predicted nucleic acid-binding protein